MKARDAYPLKSLGILSGLDSSELRALEALSRLRLLRTGECVMREDEAGDSMYILVEGEVDITKNLTLKTGRRDFGQAEKSMQRLKSDGAAVFGEMGLFGEHPRSATVTARSDCALREIARADFSRFCVEVPAAGIKILRAIAAVMAERLRKGNEDVLKLSTALSIALSR